MNFIEVTTLSPVAVVFKVKNTDIVLGQGIQHIDGYFYFAPDNTTPKSITVWSSEVLKEVSNKLHEMNQEWDNKLNNL